MRFIQIQPLSGATDNRGVGWHRTQALCTEHTVRFSSVHITSVFVTLDARGCLAWTSLGIILFLRSLYSKFTSAAPLPLYTRRPTHPATALPPRTSSPHTPNTSDAPVRFVHFGIPDFETPPVEDLAPLVLELKRRLREGEVLYVHCRGGHGHQPHTLPPKRKAQPWFCCSVLDHVPRGESLRGGKVT